MSKEKTFAFLLVCALISTLHAAPTKENTDEDGSQTQTPKTDAVVSQLEGLKTDSKLDDIDSIHKETEKQEILEETKNSEPKSQNEKKSHPMIEDESRMMSIKQEIERRLAFDKQMEILKHYSPLDLSLYILRTGDEEGVSLVIQELLAEGLITTDEALDYLQKIRETLQYYSERDTVNQYEKKSNRLMLPEFTNDVSSDMDYENILERLGDRTQTTQQSMEEIIYQLAKLLFYHATERDGEIGSEAALREVSMILSKEVERGVISVELEKRILELVIGSLVDSFNEDEITQEATLPAKQKFVPIIPQNKYRKGNKIQRNLLPFTKLSVKREAKLPKQ